MLPTVVTIWLLIKVYEIIDKNVSAHIRDGLVYIIKASGGSDAALSETWVQGFLTIAAFLVALAVVWTVGAFLASVVGRSIWRALEKFIMSTPVLKEIYPYVKQLTDFFFSQEQQAGMFSKVVAVEYPRKGIWSMGFVTGSGLEKVPRNGPGELLTVLIPTSPTPFTGFVIMVPKELTIELDITVEEALRFAVSAGVISPPRTAAAVLPTPNAQSE